MQRLGREHARRGLRGQVPPAGPTKFRRPSSVSRLTSIAMTSPSRSLPIGPPASASGPTWPMQAPVETPENRASVTIATVLPHGMYFSADVS